MKSDNQTLSAKNADMETTIAEIKKRNQALEADTNQSGASYRALSASYADLRQSYDKMTEEHEKLISGHSAETKKMIARLNASQEELLSKGDSLRKLAGDLASKEQNLADLNMQLQQREQKVKDLQSILDKKDSAVTALKNTVAKALLGFKDNGLTVEKRNGKVYVSLEERLLFPSGSWQVESKGQEALKQLARVLEKDTDINVQVEGNTDDVPMKGKGAIKDNWDLSVMRATSVIRILTTSASIDPKRLIAAGRGQYLPVEASKTPEARQKNRRTEIILTPKLDELLKVLETN